MNTARIAALYASTHLSFIFKFQGQPGQPEYINLRSAVRMIENEELRQEDAEGYHYRMDACRMEDRLTYRDKFNERCAGFVDTHCSPRMANWVRNQFANPEEEMVNLRKGEDIDQYLVTVWGHAKDESVKAKAFLRFGTREDLERAIRGMVAYQRKAQKRSRKLMAQLRAYHQQQLAVAEATKLKNGMWLGAEKAITTAARINESGVPFMGDTNLTAEQRHTMQLHYGAITDFVSGACAAFPVGTGVAMKPVTRSRQLKDGAVYLWQWSVNGQVQMQMLGRLDMSAKERGHLPLRQADTGKIPGFCWVPWADGSNVKLFRITHYTTRNAALVQPRLLSDAEFLTLPYQEQRKQDALREELAQAA